MTSPIDAAGPQATLPATYNPAAAKLNTSGTGKPPELVDSQAFLQLLVAQLKYQDPTNPVDTSNFMNQTAMLSQVQTMTSMSSTLSEMFTAQQTASATSMLGKAISFVDPSGNQVAGMVDTVSMSRGTAMLHVGDFAVPLSGVLAVANPVPVDDGGIDPTAPADGVDGAAGSSAAGSSATGSGVAGSDDGTAPATDAPGGADTPSANGQDPATDSSAEPPAGPSAATDPANAPDDGSGSAPVTRPDTVST